MSENTKLHELIQLFRYNNKHVADLSRVELIEISDLFEQLEKYQAVEEQGRLVKLPCKVGDTVYFIKSNETIAERVADMIFLGVFWEKFGKEWFLTKSEAKAKLKELGSSNG